MSAALKKSGNPAVLECYFAGKLERRIRRKIEEGMDEVRCEAEEEVLRREQRAVIELQQERREMHGAN
jgi:hypothetical protein